jgi:signal transduction histidine kinase
MALAEALARRCALAIDNARLHAQTRDALRARDTFLSVASHELGGPLARLKLHTEVLLLAQSRNSLDEALLVRSLGSIQRATNRLAAITQDLLDVARWQHGDQALRLVRLNFATLVREVVRGFKQRVNEEHRLVLHVARGRRTVVGDAVRLQQVCENILENAFKYSPDGGDVRVDLRPESGGVLLRVADHGIGIPPGSTDMIFEPFGRAANAERRSLPGMGLGLYICRSTVERHGGRIWAESPGELQGTTLNVWLPGPAQ